MPKIALIQSKASPAREENHAKALQKIEEAAKAGAKIICLQELYQTLYFCQSEDHDCFDLAEEIPGPTTESFAEIAKRLEVVIVAPYFEKRAKGLYHNSAVVIDANGSLVGTYRKMHIPDDPNFYEKFYFTPGDLGFKSFKTRYGKVGVLICWDQWFPEAARLTTLQDCDILFYPTAIGWHESETDQVRSVQKNAWQVVQQGHSVANEVFVAAVNRGGQEGELTFWGSSFVSSPFGTVLAQASETDEEILITDCDFKEIETTRQHWPFLRDRRIDAYDGLTQRYLDNK